MFCSCLLAILMVGSHPFDGAVPIQENATAAADTSPQTAPPANVQNPLPTTGATEDEKKAPGDAKKKDAPAPRSGKRHAARKAASPLPAEGEPRKIVVPHGGTREPSAQIVPGIRPDEAIRQRENSEAMLLSAEERLKRLAGRTLDARQQETVTQIRNYMDKARLALQDGDTQRGHTLALKAYLLADDLAKH